MIVFGQGDGVLFNDEQRLARCPTPPLRSWWVCRQIRALSLSFSALLALFLFPYHVLAHAVLLHSTPKAHETLASSELNVALQFNSRIDAARSSLTLLMPDGQIQKLTQLPQPSPAGLAAKTLRLAPGSYVLRWQVLANDGHITRGEIPFEVK